MMTEQPGAISIVSGSHQDRARAFSHKTGRLALAMGGMAAIVGVVGFGVPVFSVSVLGWFGTVYAVIWLAAYWLDAYNSAEGANREHVKQGWKFLHREQRHRHAVERYANGMDAGKGRR